MALIWLWVLGVYIWLLAKLGWWAGMDLGNCGCAGIGGGCEYGMGGGVFDIWVSKTVLGWLGGTGVGKWEGVIGGVWGWAWLGGVIWGVLCVLLGLIGG